MTLDDDALSRLKVKDLQRELKKRGLDVSGLKAVLLQRLKEHLQEEENAEEKPGQKEEEEKASGDKEEAPADPVSNGDEPKEEIQVEVNGGKVEDNSVAIKGVKRAADVEKDEKDTKKQKTEETTVSKPEPEDEDGKPMTTDSGKVDEDSTEAGKKEERTTLRIDNFVRPFTLNAVKALVQEFGNYVEGGFWMDAIKTHCFVTYMNPEITQKTRAALDGKAWPPENGRSLSAKLVDFTAMEVSKYGEENIPSRTKSADSNSAQATQRQKMSKSKKGRSSATSSQRDNRVNAAIAAVAREIDALASGASCKKTRSDNNQPGSSFVGTALIVRNVLLTATGP